MAQFEMKIMQLDDLGDGLKIINFEQMRTETRSLSDRIEEADIELADFWRRCNSDIHILAHVREKRYMLTNTIRVQAGVLRDLQNEERSCRIYRNSIKMKRNMLRKKLRQMRFKCGLLNKPVLLQDYARTIRRTRKIRLKVTKFRREKKEILDEVRARAKQAQAKLVKSKTQKFDEALNREVANLNKLPYPRIRGKVKPARNFDLSRYRVRWRN